MRGLRTRRGLKALGGIAFFLLLIAAVIGWTFFQWQECRALGHTVFYCINHTFG